MEKKYTIGEFSKLFNINPQTLRYYDSVGLLKPKIVNEENGYRYYLFEQTYKLASIMYLRKLGYSLKKIKEYLNSRNINYTMNYLNEQSKQLNEKWAYLLLIDNVIQRKINFIKKELPSVDKDNIIIKFFEDRKYIPLGIEEELYIADAFYFYPTIAFYEGRNKWFGAYIEESDNLIENNSITNIIEKGDFLCGYHIGSHNTIKETISKLFKSAENKYILSDLCVNFSIVDQFVESDNEKYITEVQIRILKNV